MNQVMRNHLIYSFRGCTRWSTSQTDHEMKHEGYGALKLFFFRNFSNHTENSKDKKSIMQKICFLKIFQSDFEDEI